MFNIIVDEQFPTDNSENLTRFLHYLPNQLFGRRFRVLDNDYEECKRIPLIARLSLTPFTLLISPIAFPAGCLIRTFSDTYEYKFLSLTGKITEKINEKNEEIKTTNLNVNFKETIESKSWELYLWKGFNHTWRRTVLGFKVPNRLDILKSSITPEGKVVIGQSTGVDGNWMNPKLFYTKMNSPGLFGIRGSLNMKWTDESIDGPYPQAVTEIDYPVTVPLTDEELHLEKFAVILRGIRMNTEGKDNDSGMWPYQFYVSVGNCRHYEENKEVIFDVKITIKRAWTPNLGGIRGLIEKPYTDQLTFDFDVDFTLLSGSYVNFVECPAIQRLESGQKRKVVRGNCELIGEANVYEIGVSAIRGFGFEFRKERFMPMKVNHLGRYIHSLVFNLTDNEYDFDEGKLNVQYQFQVGLPKTVIDTKVRYTLEPVFIQLRSGQYVDGIHTTSIAINSDEEAPWFSKVSYNSGHKGPVRSEVTEDI